MKTLICVFTLILVAGSFAYRTVTNTWIDNFVFNDNGSNGWKDIGNYCGSKGCLSDNPVTQGSLTKYHGPYHSIGGDGQKPIHSLSQQFYCEYPSDVSISYKYASCDADSSDRFTFYFDGNVVQNLQGNAASTTLNDNILKNNCSNWRFASKTWNKIAIVSTNQLFEPKWEFEMNAYDYFVIWDIQITCDGTPYPSNDPTASPTNVPSKKPTPSPTHSPTFIPSKSPSRDPSESPAMMPSQNPSRIPSKSPSSIPSKSPTTMPSSDPSEIPSKSPSTEPSADPTHLPSVSPTRSPSVSPSQSPTNGQTGNPTAAPSMSPTYGPVHAPTVSKDILQIDIDSNEQQFDENEVVDDESTINADGANTDDVDNTPQRIMIMEDLTNNTIVVVAAFGGLCVCILGCVMFILMVKRKQKELMTKNEMIMQTSTTEGVDSTSEGVATVNEIEINETNMNPLSINQMCEVPEKPALNETETLGYMKEHEDGSVSDDMAALPQNTKGFIDDAGKSKKSFDTKGYIGDAESKKQKPLSFNIRVVSASGMDEDDDVVDIEMDNIVNLHVKNNINTPEDSQSATNFSEMYDEDRIIPMEMEKQTTMG